MTIRDSLEQVLRSEAEGKKLLAEARLKAETMVADSETKARAIHDQANREAHEQAREIIARARSESEARRDRLLKEVEERVSRETSAREQRVTAAAQKALEYLLEE